MAKSKFTVRHSGLKQTISVLKQLGKKAPRALGDALFDEADQIIGRSKADFVPVRDGHLRASGKALLPVINGNRVTVEAGFGDNSAPYALAVHENPRAGKTGGVSPSGRQYARTKKGKGLWAKTGQWKYLEVVYREAVFGMDARIAERLRAEFPEAR